MMRTLTCPVCNREFTTDQNAKKFCSAKCRRKYNAQRARKNNLREFICGWCGDNFLSDRRKKYCSKECRLYANGRIGKRKSAPKKPMLSLEQVALLSREAGLSYGQYVHKFQLNQGESNAVIRHMSVLFVRKKELYRLRTENYKISEL